MPLPDAASEFLVLLAVDDVFRNEYNNTPPAEREALLKRRLENDINGLEATVKTALLNRDIKRINEHVFFNQQTTFAAARPLVKALDAFLATLESETTKPK